MTWNVFPDGGGVGTSATVTGLTNDQEYEFRIAGENGSGIGPYSNVMNATPVAGGALPTWSYDFTGTDGAAWSTTYFAVAEGTIQGNKGRLTTASTSFNTKSCAITNSQISHNFEFRFQVTIPTKTGILKPTPQIDGGDCEFGCASGSLRLNTSGGIQGTTTITYDAGDTLNWIIRCVGSFRGVKVWPTDVAEPSSWSIEYNLAADPTPYGGAYFVQATAVESVGANYDFDNFAWYNLNPPMPALIQSATSRAGTVTLGSPVAAGNFVIVSQSTYNASPLGTPTASGYTFTPMRAELSVPTNLANRSWFMANAPAGSLTVTFPTGGGTDRAATVAEFSNILTSSPLDVTNAATAVSATVSAGAITPTTTKSLIYACAIHEGGNITFDVDTADGFTLVQRQLDGSSGMVICAQYKVVTSTASVTPNWTLGSSQNNGGQVGVFKGV